MKGRYWLRRSRAALVLMTSLAPHLYIDQLVSDVVAWPGGQERN